MSWTRQKAREHSGRERERRTFPLFFVIRWTALGAGRRLGCGLGEGGGSHGGLVDATELVLH